MASSPATTGLQAVYHDVEVGRVARASNLEGRDCLVCNTQLICTTCSRSTQSEKSHTHRYVPYSRCSRNDRNPSRLLVHSYALCHLDCAIHTPSPEIPSPRYRSGRREQRHRTFKKILTRTTKSICVRSRQQPSRGRHTYRAANRAKPIPVPR